ncbi:hypothetical protein [Thalassomonas haliotis]|uniref:Uncharacterized protein n=1 Tax=Thalassomonas haliotis TaxID=485448 RepID=A0ABY7VEC6_9GAMM|nr:hypothetical protein [Thalassomonas haliotis]WDE11335.1 hypothetical protein H3N35_24455 [Thalassomonas haliotis]
MLHQYPEAYTYYPENGVVRLDAQILPFNVNNHQPWTQDSADGYIAQILSEQEAELTEAAAETNATIEINVLITSAKVDGVEQTNDYRLKFPVGSTTELTFELQQQDGSICALSEEGGHFAVPLERLKGEVVDSLGVQFVEGKASLTTVWQNSGEYLISESGLNIYIDNSQYVFKFKGIAFSVYK